MMNKFCVLLFLGLFCLANVKAEVDDLFPEYWDYDSQWYNDELEKLGIVSQESTEDNHDNAINEQEPPADNNDNAINEQEIPEYNNDNAVNEQESPEYNNDNAINEQEIPEYNNDDAINEQESPEDNNDNAINEPDIPEYNNDNDINEKEPSADVNNYYEEVPEQQMEENVVVEDNKEWNIEPMNGEDEPINDEDEPINDEDEPINDEDADERVQGEINQYLEEQDVDKDEGDENGDRLDVNDYLVEDNRQDALDSEENKDLDELNKKMKEETQELLAREHEGKDSEEDWEKIDGIFDENDNLEDIYDDLNDDLESLFDTWKKLSISGEESENDKPSDDTEVLDDNVDQNKSIDTENKENEVNDYEEPKGRPFYQRPLVDRDYNYDEMFDDVAQDKDQESAQEDADIEQDVDQESELAKEDQENAQQELDSEQEQDEQSDQVEEIAQEEEPDSLQEEEFAQEEEKNFEEFAQEVDEILAQGANEDSMQGEGFEQENKEYDEQSQGQDYGADDFGPESREEQDRDESYAEEEDHNLSQEDEEAAIDNIESEQDKISAKISKAAEEANKTVDELLYGQHAVYLKDTIDKPNDLESLNSEEIEEFVESDVQINNGNSLADQMAQFVIDHQEDFDTSLENFDRNIAPVFISLKVDEPTVITSPNYPEGYPSNNIIDWIFDGEGTGIELNITDFFLNGAAGDYLLVKPGGLDDSGNEGLVFSYELTSERRYRFLDVDKMFVRFESKMGMGLRGFSFSVRMIQPLPLTIEEPVTLPSVEIEEDETLKVYLGGLTPAQFLNVSQEFRSIVADMATLYVNSNGLERGNLTMLEATKLTVITACNINWPNHEYCTSVRFGVNLGIGDNRLNSEDLESMWTGYVHVDPFASRMRWLGLMEFAAPDAASAVMWVVLGFGALVCGLMLAFTVWRCGSNHYVRMPEQFDTESISSDKRTMFSDLYPTPHQNLPPLYDGDFLKYQLEDPRADLGGFPNKGYTRESELYDIESEEELPTSNRHTDV